MPVTVAVLASCAIPLVFRPVRGRFVDGALVDHYPFRRSPDGPCRTIGVVITDRPADAGAAAGAGAGAGAVPPPPRPRNFLGFVWTLVGSVVASRTSLLLSDADVRARSVVVACPRATARSSATRTSRPGARRGGRSCAGSPPAACWRGSRRAPSGGFAGASCGNGGRDGGARGGNEPNKKTAVGPRPGAPRSRQRLQAVVAVAAAEG